jgi:hypothetical protein
MQNFLSSMADKAQSAITATLPGKPTSPDAAGQPSANQAASDGGSRSYALDAIQYQLRAFGQQYTCV